MDVVTVGWLTIDDIALADGRYFQKVLGGGALYSAVGAALWDAEVGIHSVVGEHYEKDVLNQIDAYGIDTQGIGTIPGHGLELWLLHENESDKQQLPWLTSENVGRLDAARGDLPDTYEISKGFHIAPQTPNSAFKNAERLHGVTGRQVTLDLLVDSFVDAKLYSDLSFLDHLSAFMPSREEIVRLWNPPDLRRWVAQNATEHRVAIVVKMGSEGSLVCSGADGNLWRIPAYPAEVQDSTGAGDAYCGGFLHGLVQGRSLPECGVMGTVSASFVVESVGAMQTGRPTRAERERRYERVFNGVEKQ